MRLIFIRHGDPDYQKDCLTEKGQLQAKAAEPFSKLSKINPIKILDFMKEIRFDRKPGNLSLSVIELMNDVADFDLE